MSERPFMKGDAIELQGHAGIVLTDEKDGLVLVRVDCGAETWNADECKLLVRPQTTPAAPRKKAGR